VRRLAILAGALSCGVLLSAGPRPIASPAAAHEPEPTIGPAPKRFTENDRIDDLVRQYLDEYAAWSPSTATHLGLHDRDTLLDDRSRRTIDAWIAELGAFKHALIPEADIGIDEEHHFDLLVFRRIVHNALFELTEIRAWETNPLYYNEILSNSVYELAAKRFAPAHERLARIIARERQFPRLIAQAKENLANPPEQFTRKAIELSNGTAEFLAKDLPALEAEVSDDALVAAFREENARAIAAVKEYVRFLEDDLLPRSRGEFALGPKRFADMLHIGGGYQVDPAVLLKIGEKEIDRTLSELRRVAKSIPGKGDMRKKAAALAATHPPAGSLVSTTAGLLDSLRAFVIAKEIVTLPAEDTCAVVPMPPFMWGFAAMNTPGPFESSASEAYYYVKTVDPAWTPEKQEEHLSSFSPWDLANLSVHEAYPGHLVAGRAARRIASPIRRLASDYAYVEGWAHYAEQMLVDEGYGDGDPRFRFAQLRGALRRLCRFVAAIRMHTMGMTVEEAGRLFEEKALMEPFPAAREAERGAFDPGYLNYTLGKMAILKLRDDWTAQRKDAYSLKEFHDRFLSCGAIPIPIVREQMLGPKSGPALLVPGGGAKTSEAGASD